MNLRPRRAKRVQAEFFLILIKYLEFLHNFLKILQKILKFYVKISINRLIETFFFNRLISASPIKNTIIMRKFHSGKYLIFDLNLAKKLV